MQKGATKLIKNAVGRELPEKVGDYVIRPYVGPEAYVPPKRVISSNRKQGNVTKHTSKLMATLEDAIRSSGLEDGMTISFHHSFREGDYVVGMVLKAIQSLQIKNLKFAPSAVVNIKNPSIVDFIKDGTITAIEASGIRGELGDAVIDGLMATPVILRPHGARPRAIEAGELTIDVAFIGASAADDYGNCTGLIGPNACGALGYSMIDAITAGTVVVITDYLVDFPCVPISISQEYVDYVVVVDQVGNSEKIAAGAARMTKNPRDLLIAQRAAEVVAASRRFQDGFSFQTGAGAISIACTNYLSDKMAEKQVKASFALGGITAAIIEMHQKQQVNVVACSQCFDAIAAKAIVEEPTIIEIDNSVYANIARKGNFLNKETFGILGALEVDTDFNVNILTGSSGEMMGGLGGGPDVASGADISIVTLPIVRGRTPSIVKRVFTCCTPGDTIAVVVTEAGIALNPKHPLYEELKADLSKTPLKLVTIEALQAIAEALTGVPEPIETTDKVVCVVEYRDGTVIDVIRQIKR
jgi:citrate lyase subunit alpha/citrate CoA-transferase